ncbi:MAG: hypothetical protein ACXW32_03975 [Limisphaerales bacterium]
MLISRVALILAFAATALVLSAHEKAGEQKFTAILIWGTDGDKPEDKEKELKDVDPALKVKFGNIFKWKNYFEVTRTNITVKPAEPRNIKLSSKCEVKINHTDKGTEFELIGEGKSMAKHTVSMPLKDIQVIAGPDKNATAWFVVLKPE